MSMLCPSEERLADYIEGRLAGEDTSRLEKHLSDCDTCLETFVITNGLLQGRGLFICDPVPGEVTESTVQLLTRRRAVSYGAVLENLKQSVENWGKRILYLIWPRPWRKWQQATIRSSSRVAFENLIHIRVPFEGIETEIEIEKTGDDKAHIRVRLSERNKPRKLIRVTLKQDEREVASYLLDAGEVLFEDTPFGHYGISLAQDDVKLGTYFFEIKEN